MTESHTAEFLAFCQQRAALKFGEFKLKSGRISPYFFNAGAFLTGGDLDRLARFYAQAIVASRLEFDGLFGPAYKGIPLVAAVAMVLARDHQRDLPWTFNRKEAKDHGEGGSLVGAPLRGRILIVDDVITAGTAIREALAIIRRAGAIPVAVTVALDREEVGPSGLSAIGELERDEGLDVVPVARFRDLEAWVADAIDDADAESTARLSAIRAYRERYGMR
ncbi:MAG: orotate phosphoribosyltransferase [Thioalkalivibrionaceae bacterium]